MADLLQKLENELREVIKFCPSCGSEDLRITIQTAENHLYCRECDSELFKDVDYSSVIKKRLQYLQTAKEYAQKAINHIENNSSIAAKVVLRKIVKGEKLSTVILD